jgi:DNA primase
MQIETLPHYKKKTSKEYSASCPNCGGQDRFLFWPDTGNFWCRQCDEKGFILDVSGGWTKEERARYMAQAAERAEAERQAKRQALDGMATQAETAYQYHQQMTDRSYWYGQGLTDETINYHQLGYCPACPTYYQSPSHTIPVFFKGKLLNIRHRLANPPAPGDKYRPEKAGIPATIFNADTLLRPSDYVVLVEGEVKTMVLEQYGFPTVGIPGANIFPTRWAGWFAKVGTVYVALDPGLNGRGCQIAGMLGERARVVTLPVKPDDFFVIYGGSVADFHMFLWQGRRV